MCVILFTRYTHILKKIDFLSMCLLKKHTFKTIELEIMSSYDESRIKKAKNNILIRVAENKIIRQSSIDNLKYEWTDSERSALKKHILLKKTKELYVPKRSEDYVDRNRDRISDRTNGFVNLMDENLTSQSHLSAKRKCVGKNISESDITDAFKVLVDQNVLLKDKSDIQKKIGLRKYASKINVVMKIYGTDNVLDLYVYPERFFNKLATSHLSDSSIKDYLSLFVSFYRKSGNFPSNSRLTYVKPTIRELQTLIPLIQIKPLQDGMKRTIKLSKENEIDRLDNASSYKWEDIKRIPSFIASDRDANTVGGLRDQVIARFYIDENVLRDNLGAIVVGTTEPRDKESTSDAIRNKPNYLNLKTKYMYLNDFKTSTIFKNFKLRISDETMDVVSEYLAKVEEETGHKPTHLITKNDGKMYKDGKLSSYISDMFRKYTKAEKFTINDLRHSVATYHRNSGQRIKEYIAYLLQHSFLQHIRYERHSGKFIDFSVNDLRSSEQIQHQPSTTREEHIDTIYINNKVLVVVQVGSRKGSILVGRVRMNESKTKDKFRYQVRFYDSKIGPLDTNLPNRYIVLS